jgi:hypothetical protein
MESTLRVYSKALGLLIVGVVGALDLLLATTAAVHLAGLIAIQDRWSYERSLFWFRTAEVNMTQVVVTGLGVVLLWPRRRWVVTLIVLSVIGILITRLFREAFRPSFM